MRLEKDLKCVRIVTLWFHTRGREIDKEVRKSSLLAVLRRVYQKDTKQHKYGGKTCLPVRKGTFTEWTLQWMLKHNGENQSGGLQATVRTCILSSLKINNEHPFSLLSCSILPEHQTPSELKRPSEVYVNCIKNSVVKGVHLLFLSATILWSVHSSFVRKCLGKISFQCLELPQKESSLYC